MPKNTHPALTKLKYDTVYCGECRHVIHAGQNVGWLNVHTPGGKLRPAAYCPSCFRAHPRGRPR